MKPKIPLRNITNSSENTSIRIDNEAEAVDVLNRPGTSRILCTMYMYVQPDESELEGKKAEGRSGMGTELQGGAREGVREGERGLSEGESLNEDGSQTRCTG